MGDDAEEMSRLLWKLEKDWNIVQHGDLKGTNRKPGENSFHLIPVLHKNMNFLWGLSGC